MERQDIVRLAVRLAVMARSVVKRGETVGGGRRRRPACAARRRPHPVRGRLRHHVLLGIGIRAGRLGQGGR